MNNRVTRTTRNIHKNFDPFSKLLLRSSIYDWHINLIIKLHLRNPSKPGLSAKQGHYYNECHDHDDNTFLNFMSKNFSHFGCFFDSL